MVYAVTTARRFRGERPAARDLASAGLSRDGNAPPAAIRAESPGEYRDERRPATAVKTASGFPPRRMQNGVYIRGAVSPLPV